MRLSKFRTALTQHPEALEELSGDTLLRYAKGDFPKAVRWLMRYPALLRALADDAEAKQLNSHQKEEVPA